VTRICLHDGNLLPPSWTVILNNCAPSGHSISEYRSLQDERNDCRDPCLSIQMSAPGRTWHRHADLEVRSRQEPAREISDVREQVEALLAWAEAHPTGAWQVADEERAFMTSVSELFGVSIPFGTFESAGRAASFLRVVARALQD
jgi:hypothetical protein